MKPPLNIISIFYTVVKNPKMVQNENFIFQRLSKEMFFINFMRDEGNNFGHENH